MMDYPYKEEQINEQARKLSDKIRRLLKEWNITDTFYVQVREFTDIDNDHYDELVLEHNAPLGKDRTFYDLEFKKNGWDKINPDNFDRKFYYDLIAWGLATAKYFENQEDADFFNHLAKQTLEDYDAMEQSLRWKFIEKSIHYSIMIQMIDDLGLKDCTELTLLHNKRTHSLQTGKELKNVRIVKPKDDTPKDFDFAWQVAIYCRLQIAEGHLINHIEGAYQWGLKHCTIKGKKIKSTITIFNGWKNGKRTTRADVEIAKFEEKYYNKI